MHCVIITGINYLSGTIHRQCQRPIRSPDYKDGILLQAFYCSCLSVVLCTSISFCV